MARVKGGVASAKRRKNILLRAKGYRHGRSTKVRLAKESLVHAGKNAFNHRRDKKTDFRQLWIVRLNAAIRDLGFKSYSTFIAAKAKANVDLDRKVLATLAATEPEVFARVAKQIQG
ncbi:50S ribosomal protein L20 [Patescibacteria group bacterium]|nr:50S ribosomal protein L20 [Patescibacteria group bacterium]MBU2158818.1 50S ribosomal protein L20 [Patescibacteria group bacterium]MBU2220976.1 50S ribosomal protein L20 [Patescibacteria group bacterium]